MINNEIKKRQLFMFDNPHKDANLPTEKYQIISMIYDVHLFSELNRDLIVGRPTGYFVVDVFSQMVVGMYVGLESTSWSGVTMALVNTVTDKVKFCSQYGINISEDQWPSKHLPDSILVDYVKPKGYEVEKLISLGIRVENTPFLKGDRKGIIEQLFIKINQWVKPFVQGSVAKSIFEESERNLCLDTRLTLKKFNEIIIHSVLFYNNSQWLKNYPPNGELIAEDLPLVPIALWKWGTKKKVGMLPMPQEDLIKLQLLDRGEGRITKKGILFKGIYYTCKKVEVEGWYRSATLSAGKSKVTLVVDRGNINEISLLLDDGSYEICYLLPQYSVYSNLTFSELKVVKDMEEKKRRQWEKNHLQE